MVRSTSRAVGKRRGVACEVAAAKLMTRRRKQILNAGKKKTSGSRQRCINAETRVRKLLQLEAVRRWQLPTPKSCLCKANWFMHEAADRRNGP